MKAVIMAGGKGTRLRSVSEELPKPMVPVLGRPILEYQIRCLQSCGITDITIVTGYKAEYIHSYFGDGSKLQVHISYIHEDQPLGTAGALYYLREEPQEDILLIMGDLMLSVDFVRFMDAHKRMGGRVTLFTHPNAHPYDSDVIVTDRVGRLEDFTEDVCGEAVPVSVPRRDPRVLGVLSKSEERHDYYHNMVNSGIYALSMEVIRSIKEPVKLDLDKDIIRPLIAEGQVMAYHSTEYVKDMGTPERYGSVSRDIESGLVRARDLRQRQKAIFLDRDGTINRYVGFLRRPEDLELLPGAAEAIRLINDSEYLAIVVTNQPVIARGEVSFEGLDEIHRKLETELGRQGAYVDDILYCPHHRDSGFEGEIRELKFNCSCRKPSTGLLCQAAELYNIDLEGSVMIGDSESDICCGREAGMRTILIGAEGEQQEHGESLQAASLYEAVARLLKR